MSRSVPSLIVALAWLAAAPVHAEAFQQVDVFLSGQEGYHTYRIPAIAVTGEGTVLAFCEGRKTSASDHGDVDVVLRRSTDGGKTFGPMHLVHEEGGDEKVTIGNPTVVVDRHTGTIWLALCRDNDRVLITRSDDDGQTWARPTDWTGRLKVDWWTWYATGPGHGTQLTKPPHRGRLMIPCNHTNAGKRQCWSHVFFSDDHGATWQLGGNVPDDHTSEPEIVQLVDGTLMMNTRNWPPREAHRRAVSLSSDGGLTWSRPYHDPALITPHCQGSIIRYTAEPEHAKNRILFSNPASTEAREKMTVRLSYDEGKTWSVARLVHAGPAAYSCLVVLPDMTIGCLYEGGQSHRREWIRLARFTLGWLTHGADTLPKTRKAPARE
ncbi:MAG: sialidase family protein [Planctomycetota bacterium]|jgi:sialidase-1